jgi:hypothetical protein
LTARSGRPSHAATGADQTWFDQLMPVQDPVDKKNPDANSSLASLLLYKKIASGS